MSTAPAIGIELVAFRFVASKSSSARLISELPNSAKGRLISATTGPKALQETFLRCVWRPVVPSLLRH